MNKTQRIFINSENKDTDKHIKVKLEQSTKTLEFLSMSIDTTDVYQSFNSDYGVLVGRVIANNSIGIPNAKISIFIPLTDTDSNDPNIYSLYPYTTPRDVNNEGKRYNLLPRVGKYVDGTARPPQPFGSLPIKEEFVVNEEFLNVYKKYYKYTATTNNAGDYMIFGVPIGTQTVHMSVDITDIGKYSMSPASMIKSLGYSENLFINGTIIKPSNDLNDLPHIETQEVGVDIIPFWGDVDNFEIGITRQDFKIRSVITNTFTLFASAFTDADGCLRGDSVNNTIDIPDVYRANDADNNVSISTKRTANVTEKIYYYPSNVSDEDIDDIDPDIANPIDSMMLLDKSQYSIYKRNGDFVIIVNCNRNKVITDEFGNEINVDDDYSGGVFTKFRGFLTLEINNDTLPMNFTHGFEGAVATPYRIILKFPQYAERNHSFSIPNNNEDINDTKIWRKKHHIFSAGKFYSLARFHGTAYNTHTSGGDTAHNEDNGFFNWDRINEPYNLDPFSNVGVIATNSIGDELTNIESEFPSNSITNQVPSNTNLTVFGANWLNMSVYLPQLGNITKNYSRIKYVRTSNYFSHQKTDDKTLNYYFVENNTQGIAAGDINTKWFARSDLHWTDIIEVPITDIKTFKSVSKKGFTNTDIIVSGLTGQNKTYNDINYRNGINIPSNWSINAACPINGGKINGNPTLLPDPKTYFYKGLGNSNCVDYLFDLGLII